jgi:hypothetical protein
LFSLIEEVEGMLRRALSLCAVLAFASAAHAGAVITLVPTPNQATYNFNEVVHVDVLAQLDSSSPASVRVRAMQFDVGASDAALGITPVLVHPVTDNGPISFWDLHGASICAGDEASCGTNYFIDGSLASDDLVSATYIGLTSSGLFQVILSQGAPTRVGQLEVTMPGAEGTYLLDLLNAADQNVNNGALLVHGFGSPTDPRVDLTARANQISNGQLRFTVIPEPATLVLLGLGGVAAVVRRRRTA